jgi:hypothetical protein
MILLSIISENMEPSCLLAKLLAEFDQGLDRTGQDPPRVALYPVILRARSKSRK